MSTPVTIERTSFGEYARSRDVTRPYISKLAKKILAPAIVVDEDGRRWINPTAADAIMASRGDPGRRAGSRERKARAAGRVAPPVTPDCTPPNAATDIDAKYQAQRAEAILIENDRRRVKLDKERGNLIDRTMGERLVRDLASGFGKMAERYPDRIATQIAAQLGVDAHKCRTLLTSMAKELRAEFERFARGLPERLEVTEQ